MPTHRLLEGTDIAKLLQQVRDEHGEDAKIVRAERVRTGGLGGFFSKEHFELAIEIDPEGQDLGEAASKPRANSDAMADLPAPKAKKVAPVREVPSEPADTTPDLFGAVMNSEFRRSVKADKPRKSEPLIPDDATELVSPVDVLVSGAPDFEDTFTPSSATPARSDQPAVDQKPSTPGRRTVRDFTPAKVASTRVVDGDDAGEQEQPAAMITPDVAQQILAAAAAAVAAAEATTRSIEDSDVVAAKADPAAVPKRRKLAQVAVAEQSRIEAIATATAVIEDEEPDEEHVEELVEEPARGRHSKGNPVASTQRSSAGSDREALHRPFLGLATSSSLDSVTALTTGALDAAASITSSHTPFSSWLSSDDDAGIDQLPWPPRRPGEVLVLVGDAIAALHSARDIARHTRLGSGSVFVVAPDLLPELSEERRIANPTHARQRRAELSQSASASIIVIDAPLTMAGDPLAAQWVNDMVQALSATAVWAVVDATRRPKDVRRWIDAIGGADAIVAHDVAATSEPGELLQLGAPVAYLDGVHATAAAWHAVHAHAMSLEFAAARSTSRSRELTGRASS